MTLREPSPAVVAGRALRHADRNLSHRHLPVFLLALQTQRWCPDLAAPRKLPHFVHMGAVADRVLDGGLAQGVNADALLP